MHNFHKILENQVKIGYDANMTSLTSILTSHTLEQLHSQRAWIVVTHSHEVDLVQMLWAQEQLSSYASPTIVTEKYALAKLHKLLDSATPQLTFLQAKELFHQCQMQTCPRSFSDHAYSAYTLQKMHQLPIVLDWTSPWHHTMTQEWINQYRQALQSKHLADPLLTPQNMEKTSTLPETLVCLIDHPCASLIALAEKISLKIRTINPYAIPSSSSTLQGLYFESIEQEIAAAQHWMQASHGRAIGYFYPSSPHNVAFNAYLEPDITNTTPYTQALHDYTGIQEKLLLSRPHEQQWPLSAKDLSVLLMCPRLLTGCETEPRQKLDIVLREQPRPEWDLDDIIHYTQEHAPLWSQVLRQWHDMSQSSCYIQEQTPNQIIKLCDLWQHKLNHAPWLEQAWHDLVFESLQSLSFIDTKHNYHYRYQQLIHLTQNTQARKPPNSDYWIGPYTPIIRLCKEQWIAGCSNQQLPQPINTHPLLPHSDQQSIPLMQASYQKKRHRMIFDHTDYTTMSFSQNENNLPSHVSIYCQDKTTWIKENAKKERSLFLEHTKRSSYHNASNPEALPLSRYRSGSQLLEQQIQCPFKAYIKQRLKLPEFPKQQIGPPPSLFGQALHLALAHFWGKTQSQAQLLQYNEGTLKKAIQSSVHDALTTLKQTSINPRLAQRLQSRLQLWLALERDRPPFKVIAVESSHEFTMANITYQLRIDRIDQLEDGSFLIIDYKTGLCNKNTWLDATPISPQMPLYSLSVESHAITFAQTYVKQAGFSGISACSTGIHGVKNLDQAEWNNTQANWRINLHRVSEEFLNGVRVVSPHSPETCSFCDLKSLCRLHDHMHNKKDAQEPSALPNRRQISATD